METFEDLAKFLNQERLVDHEQLKHALVSLSKIVSTQGLHEVSQLVNSTKNQFLALGLVEMLEGRDPVMVEALLEAHRKAEVSRTNLFFEILKYG